MRNQRIFSFGQLWNDAPFKLYWEVKLLQKTPQSPKWHPEGDCLVHTKIVFNRALASGDVDLILAAFFHDIGKVRTTKRNKKGNWSAHGHEVVSTNFVDEFSDWILRWGGNPADVKWLVLNHMRMKQFTKMRPVKQKKLTDHPLFDKLVTFSEFDTMSTASTGEVFAAGGNVFRFLWFKILKKFK